MGEYDDLGEPDLDLTQSAPDTPFQSLSRASRLPAMTTASALIEEESEPADLGFEPDNRYLSFQILGEQDWPDVSRHQIWKQRFYVLSPKGIVGVVPWPGSRIIWPWETGWQADMHRDIVTSLLKEPEREKKKRG
jgi:hypothetical protein